MPVDSPTKPEFFMLWDMTFLVVEFAAFYAIVMLSRRPPDVLQAIFLAMAGCSMLVYIGADLAALYGVRPVWPIRLIASRVEHAAVLLYLLRQFWITTGICQSLKSLRSPDTSRS